MGYENNKFEGDLDPVCQLFTGGHFNYKSPERSVLNIQDIAHSLANQCRFNGHTKVFYSVAEHSILCYQYLDNLKNEDNEKVPLSADTLMYGLLHEAAEAVISDIPTPFKGMFPELKEKENLYLKAIFDLLELDLDDADKDIVKVTDTYMLLYEAKKLLSPATRFKLNWGPYISNDNDLYKEVLGNEFTEDDLFISAMSPEEAEGHFISIFNDLRWRNP